MVKCKYCEREFKNENAFHAHKCEGYVNERKSLKEQKEKENSEGEYICNGCGKHFKTMGSLRSHARFCENYTPIKKYDENGKYISTSKYKISDNEYKCECGNSFTNVQSLRAHFSHCVLHHESTGIENKFRKHEILHVMSGWENKTEEEIKKYKEKAGRKHSKNLKTGKTKNHWCGKKHTKESLQHHREAGIRTREKFYPGCKCAYNINGCNYIDKLNEEKGWNLQHALNGGEIEMFGYFLDGYDKERNIVFEYDEPGHYENVYENILKEKDIKRQNYIKEKLNCKFYRYNEKLDLFYEV